MRMRATTCQSSSRTIAKAPSLLTRVLAGSAAGRARRSCVGRLHRRLTSSLNCNSDEVGIVQGVGDVAKTRNVRGASAAGSIRTETIVLGRGRFFDHDGRAVTKGRLDLERNAGGEDLDGGQIPVAFAWTVVQGESNLGAARLSEAPHGGALWDVLANQAVRILVSAAFPRAVRCGEVESGVGELLDLAITVKLGAVVDGDGLEQVPMGADQMKNAPIGGCN